MPMEICRIDGQTVLLVAAEGPPLGSERDATDLIGDALSVGAGAVAIPVARLDPAFLDLSSRMAGLMIQKFTNYRLNLVFVGDISAALARSEALRAFVIESNRGRGVRFVETL
eukprot:gene14623-14420_t